MIKELLLQLITLAHIIFILFVISIPFLDSNYLLLLHIIILPFIVLHWVLNDNTCALTVAEKYLRKNISENTKEEDCLTCQLIEPVYDFKKNYDGFSKIIYSVTFILWSISLFRLFYKYKVGDIKTIKDLFQL